MCSVLADGPRRHRLADGTGADVGWIRGRAIGFRGLRNKSDVMAAASAGWRSLQTCFTDSTPAGRARWWTGNACDSFTMALTSG